MRRAFLWLAGPLASIACAAHADPGGTSNVSGPTTSPGELRLEARTSMFDGGALDGDRAHRLIASYGFSQWWRAGFIVRASQPDGDAAELSSLALDSSFDFTATREWPLHLGAQVEYKFGLHDRPDNAELKLIGERRFEAGAFRINLKAERDFSSGADWVYEYASRLMFDAGERLALGLEAFGEPEADAHYIGPRAEFDFGDVTLAGGYLFGAGDAQADGQLRLSIQFSR